MSSLGSLDRPWEASGVRGPRFQSGYMNPSLNHAIHMRPLFGVKNKNKTVEATLEKMIGLVRIGATRAARSTPTAAIGAPVS